MSVRSRSAVAMLLLLTGSPALASPQDTADRVIPQRGDRVRLTLRNRAAPAPLAGTLLRISSDSLVVEREEGGIRELGRAQVARLEVSVERRYETDSAAGYGLLAAAPFLGLGFVFAVVADVGGLVLPTLLAFAAGAAAVGTLIGGTTNQDVWVEAEWPAEQTPVDSISP